MTSSNADVIPAEASDATCAEASDVAATKAADVTSAEAAHVAATKTAAVSAAAGLCTGGNKAAGKQRTCQNHYQSSSHDISPLGWADVPPQDLRQLPACFSKANADAAMDSRWAFLAVVSIKFAFNQLRLNTPAHSNKK
jgi:hypothetical protein